MTPKRRADTAPSDDKIVAMRLARPVIMELVATGTDVNAVLQEVGIDPADLLRPDARLSHASLVSLWLRAEEVTADPNIGLRVLERVKAAASSIASFGSDYLVMQLVVSSATVGEAIERFIRYFKLSHGGASAEMERAEGALRLRFTLAPGLALPRSMAELLVGFILSSATGNAQEPIAPIEVRFAHGAPADTTEHERIFGAPVRFSAGENGFVLPEAALAVPLRSANAAVAAQLEQRADELLARTRPADSVALRARELILLDLGNGPTARRLAERLGMSERTLARSLEAVGLSHKRLVDEVRAELAKRHLIEEGMEIGEVAARLGFADPTTFMRAFRRWFGQTVTELRREHGRARGRKGQKSG